MVENCRDELGSKKVRKIHSHITGSKHTRYIIEQTKEQGIFPRGNDFVTVTLNHMRYGFAARETVFMAAYIMFEYWADQLSKDSYIIGEEDMAIISMQIYEACSHI